MVSRKSLSQITDGEDTSATLREEIKEKVLEEVVGGPRSIPQLMFATTMGSDQLLNVLDDLVLEGLITRTSDGISFYFLAP